MPIGPGPGPGPVQVAGLFAPPLSAPQTGPVPKMIVSTPQAVDYGLVAGIGLIFASVFNPQGASASSETQYGTHAVATYNAEAVKTQIRGSAPGQQGPTVRSFVSQPPQQDLTQQSIFSRPLPAAQGKLGTMVVLGPQIVDLTQKSSIQPAIRSSPGKLGTMVVAPPQSIDLTQQSRISPPAASVIITKLGTFVVTAPQADLTQQSTFYSIQANPSAPFGGAQYTFGTHAVALYNAEAVKTQLYPSVRSPPPPNLGAFVNVPAQSVDLTQQSQIYPAAANPGGWILTWITSGPDSSEYIQLQSSISPSAAAPPAQGSISGPQYTFGTHAAAFYNAEAIKTQIYPSARAPTAPPTNLGAFVNVPAQLVDLTQKSSIQPSAPGIQGVTVRPNIPVPPQSVDLTQQSIVRASSLAVTYAIKSYVTAPQLIDFTQQSIIVASSPGIQGTTVRPIVQVNPQIDLTQQSIFSVPLIAPPQTSFALRSYTSAPQGIDLTIQSVIIPSSPGQQGRTVTPNVPVPPQSVDLTQQSQFYKPLALPQRSLLTSYFSTPQLVDLTQQSNIYKPLLTFQGRVPPYTITAPQLLDLTQQSVIARPLVPGPIFGRNNPYYVSQPPQIDLTIQSQVFPAQFRALIFGPTVSPNPFVPAQFDITVNGTQIWTPSTFSPSGPIIIPPQPTIKGGRVILSSKKPSEIIIEQVDFISQLGQGETILTAVCTCTVYTGVDANPSAMISGAATFSGTVVSQLVTGGVLGTIYEFLATVTTSLSQKIELAGYLAVIPDLI
jgi:hypothetical protein